MMRKIPFPPPFNLAAALNFLNPRCTRRFSSGDSAVSSNSRVSELSRVDSLVDGCDYKHWLVVMHPPENYPQRDEIVQQYVATLATALGSEEAAKKSIYSVSTKYYYAFSCQVTEDVTHKIKTLPRVQWVLPDSYLSPEEKGYGGEPYVEGKVVPYEEKYHAHWFGDGYKGERHKPSRRKRRGPETSK